MWRVADCNLIDMTRGRSNGPSVKAFRRNGLWKKLRMPVQGWEQGSATAQSTNETALYLTCDVGRSPKDVLPGSLRLPDERPRFGEGRRHAPGRGVPAGSDRRR